MVNQYFRSAFRGFNREDVVRYIEYLNKQHNAQIAQLKSQLQALKEAGDCDTLREELAAANARCAELEAALERATDGHPVVSATAEELEAYRRAERAERLAMDRAGQIYAQANAVLADATLKAEEASAGLSDIAQQITDQFASYQHSIQTTRDTLQEAVTALYSIKPEE